MEKGANPCGRRLDGGEALRLRIRETCIDPARWTVQGTTTQQSATTAGKRLIRGGEGGAEQVPTISP